MQVDEILNLVNHDLGIEHDQLYNDTSKVCDQPLVTLYMFIFLLQVFIFVSTQKKVIGCVVADQIEKVYIMFNLPAIMVCII